MPLKHTIDRPKQPTKSHWYDIWVWDLQFDLWRQGTQHSPDRVPSEQRALQFVQKSPNQTNEEPEVLHKQTNNRSVDIPS